MVLFLSGYDLSEPGIGLGGLVPSSLSTHHHIPPLSYSELELIFFSGMSVSNRPSVLVGSLPLLYDPLLPLHCQLFPSLIFFFLGLLSLPSLVRMGPLEPEIGPFHGLFAPLVERCQHPIPGIVLGGLVPPPFRPTSTIPPPSFSEFVIFFARAHKPPEPVTYGTFLARNRALPRPLRCPRRTMSASHPGYRFGWASSPSLSTHHHYPPPSTGDAQTVHPSC